MNVQVVTMWYNEEFLAPLFLNHYSFADRVHIFFDSDTLDGTAQICSRFNNVHIHPFSFPDMMDDQIKVNIINKFVENLDCDWVINVDADEFIFPLPVCDPRKILARQTNANLLYVQFWQVYRNIRDKDINQDDCVIWQRRYGDPNVSSGINKLYNKPVVVKPETNIKWQQGNHFFNHNENIIVSPEMFWGTHWAMADSELAINRRIYGRRDRQSQYNLENKLSYHQHFITEDDIINECKFHQNDPELFELPLDDHLHPEESVSIVLPVIRREKAERCIRYIKENAGIPESQYEIIVQEDVERIGCPKMVKKLVDRSQYNLICFLGDDTLPQQDFLRNALIEMSSFSNGWGLIGITDQSFQERATHWLAHKRLLYILDGEFFNTEYYHTHCDDELVDRCKEIGRYKLSRHSILFHDNPILCQKETSDPDYNRVYNPSKFLHDKNLYRRRRRNGWK